ncbi:DUF6708 domain-containing protein [Burkholderia gladioli]|jgi:hypothetical protein|uniref:DUF6708 domain-containing protein n=1 Tax=Burkholderia gladioli TaxID=28095 RepID=UPI00163FAB30|nr:DUF6708 domain-containing protein [Burkholderia gladioli]
MDERVMRKLIGKPIPEWDISHRLKINQTFGPNTQDFGTVFQINSRFMDVTEPSFLEKQWFITGVAVAFLSMGIGPYVYSFTHADGSSGDFIMDCLAIAAVVIFGRIVLKLGRGLFFGVCRRPIRFHRETRKLYAIHSRRYFLKSTKGDIVWEAPWSTESIFCLHRERTSFGTIFHIRHYTLDDNGNVARVFSIGREWTGYGQIGMALAQWNYWCAYMNDGPGDLPKPMLFHTQQETLREAFLFSLYSFGMRAPVIVRLLMMPHILVFTVMRVLANATCRDPIWPESIERISQIAPDDPYAEPRPGTPVGWGDTILAQQRGEYPDNPQAPVKDWKGEMDEQKNAAAWLENPAAAARRTARGRP